LQADEHAAGFCFPRVPEVFAVSAGSPILGTICFACSCLQRP